METFDPKDGVYSIQIFFLDFAYWLRRNWVQLNMTRMDLLGFVRGANFFFPDSQMKGLQPSASYNWPRLLSSSGS